MFKTRVQTTRFFAASLLLCLITPCLLCQTQSRATAGNSLDALIKQALVDYQSGQLDTALRGLREAEKIAPDNAFVRFYLGLMLYEKDPAGIEAQRLMESVLDEVPANPDLYLRLLDSYLRLKASSKAAALIERMKKPMASDNRFAFTVIYSLVRYDQLDLAKRELQRVEEKLKGGPEGGKTGGASVNQAVGEVDFIQGLIAADAGKKEEALKLFQDADRLEFPPPKSIQMQMLAEALLRLDEYKLSIQAYKVYLESFPRDANARMHLAIGYYSSGLFTQAAENFRKVLEEAPETPNVHLYLGMILLEQKDNEEARKHLQKELDADPKSYQSMAELAYLDYLNGDDEKSLRWLDKAQPLNPDWYETNMVHGLLYNRQGQFDRAIKCLESVVQARPKYYKAHFQLSLAYRRSGNEAKAEEHFKIYEQLLAEEKARQLEGVSR